MGLDLNYIYGQTPIEEDEKEGLLIQTISIRGELIFYVGTLTDFSDYLKKKYAEALSY